MQEFDRQTYKGYDDLAIRVGLKFDFGANTCSKSNVIVDFTVDGQNNLSIVTDQGLRTGI